MAALGPVIAIFPWGEVIEEFLDPLGLTIEDFAAKMTGGWLFGYVQALQSQGWHPIIVCASDSVKRTTRLEHAATAAPIWLAPGKRSGNGAARSPSLQYIGQWLRTPGRHFAEILTREQCVAVISQEYEYFRFDLLSLLARRAARPLYATFQGGDVTLSAIERQARPWSLRRCDGLIVASARERARLTSAYPGLRVPVANIPNPLDSDEWRPEPRATARARLELPDDAFVVVSHGRTDIGRKGLDVLVEAWKRFAPLHPAARAFLIGNGQDHDAFATLLARQAPPRLTWIDSYITDRRLMRRWLSAADAYLITSRVEGMPVAPLEAMACGLPVISSDAHGLPDIFAAGEDHGGVLTGREDHDGIVHALERLIGDPRLRSRLGHAARRRVETWFSIPAVGAALSQLIRGPAV
jgi:glycosyltransferase involved in cell wall biosynthesis